MTQLAEVVQAGREAGLATDEMRDAITVYEPIADALRGRGEEPAPHSLEAIVRDAERWREHAGADSEDLAAELDRANERIERLQAQAQGGGGTDHPSCWYDDDGTTVAYLFDVAMNAEGYVIQPARSPQHERKRASLPLSQVQTGRQLDPGQFQDQTQEIFDWSVREECRFFVRAFYLTPDQKELYKERMRILESHFYKKLNPSGPPPSEDPPTVREAAERR